jgi:8-oxo-dGTP pyrophosphatase MutT (NUDIX family)
MDWYPHITVATVIEQDGKFLLVEEFCNGELVFNQPAGHLDPNESLQQAAVRETYEETGWHINLSGVVGQSLNTSKHNDVTYHRTTFYAQADRHDPEQVLDDGIERIVWMSFAEMQQQAARMRSPLVIKCVQQYLNGHRYPLEMIFD